MSKSKTERLMNESPQPPEGQVAADSTEAAVENLAKERDNLQDQLLRAMADLQNFRRRVQQEKEETRKYATENLVSDLLPVLDNLERTIQAADSGADFNVLIEGVRAVDRQLRTVLQGVKLSRISSRGEQFNPEQHEAIALEESSEFEEGTIVEEIEPGYALAEKVIRPARVRIAKRP